MTDVDTFAQAPWGVFPTDVTLPLPTQMVSSTDNQRLQTGTPPDGQRPVPAEEPPKK